MPNEVDAGKPGQQSDGAHRDEEHLHAAKQAMEQISLTAQSIDKRWRRLSIILPVLLSGIMVILIVVAVLLARLL